MKGRGGKLRGGEDNEGDRRTRKGKRIMKGRGGQLRGGEDNEGERRTIKGRGG